MPQPMSNRARRVQRDLLNIQRGDSVVVSSTDPTGGIWDLSVDVYEFTEETTEAIAMKIAARTIGAIHSIKKAD